MNARQSNLNVQQNYQPTQFPRGNTRQTKRQVAEPTETDNIFVENFAEESQRKRRIPIIEVTIGGIPVNLLVDSGAEASIINKGVFPKELESKLENPKVIITGKKKEVVDTYIWTWLPKEFQDKNKVIVTFSVMDAFEDKPYNGILGNDVLIPLQMELSYKTNIMKVNGQEIHFKNLESHKKEKFPKKTKYTSLYKNCEGEDFKSVYDLYRDTEYVHEDTKEHEGSV